MATVTSTETFEIVHDISRPTPAKCSPSAILDQPHTLEPFTIEDVAPPTTTTEPEETVYPTGAKFWLTILAICLFIIPGGLDANIVATAVPSITDEFHTVQDVGWYSSAFRLCTCSFQFFFGKMYKLFSIKKVFIASNLIFLVGNLLCATAPTSWMFVVGRAVTGVGFAGGLAGCFAVIIELVPLDRRAGYTGTMACVESCAIIAAPIVGGLLTQSLGWRWCFWINLPVGGIAVLAVIFLFSDPQARHDTGLTFWQKMKEADLVSNCLLIPGLTALFIALSWAGTKFAWSDGRVIGLFVVFAVLCSAFLYNQWRQGDSAAVPFRIISNRNVLAGFIFTMCTNSMTNVLEYYLPTYYQVVRGLTPGESGVRMIPILLGMMIGLFLQGWGTTALGYYKPFMLFASVCMPIAAGLMTTFDLNTNLAQMILYSGFAGFAGGIGFQGSQSAVQTTLPAEDVSMGTGVILFGQSLGPAIATAIGQVIFTNTLADNLKAVIPGLTATMIEQSGLTDIKNMVPMEHWNQLFVGVGNSLTKTWYLAIALGCTTLVGSLMIEWRSVKHKQE